MGKSTQRWLASSLLCLACAEPAPLSLEVTSGQEEGALALDPAVAKVTIVALDGEGQPLLETSAAPGESFDLGEVPEDTLLTFDLTGATSDGEVVARGRSISMLIGSINVNEGSLPLFIQRTGGFSRPPGGVIRPHIHAPGGVFGEQFLVHTGGARALGEDGDLDTSFGDFYDLLSLSGYEAGSLLPRSAKSLVVLGTTMLLIDDEGATFVDFDTSQSSEAVAPEGFSFSEVAGGFTLIDENDVAYVIGATRPNDPTTAVLVVDGAGDLSVTRLSTARAGAAAVYAPGVGIVVVGGADSGPGVETLADDGVTVGSVPYPTDPTTGAAAVLTGEQQIAVLGGRISEENGAPTRVLDLRCVAECVAQEVQDANLPELFARGRSFAVPDGLLTVGENEEGETLAFLVKLDPATVTALPLREPRRGATPIPAPNGPLAIVGGETLSGAPARSIELFFTQ